MKKSKTKGCKIIEYFLSIFTLQSILVFLCIATISNGYIVRTGIPIGWNYGLWYGITSSLENVKRFCATVDLNQPEPMSVSTYAAVQSCKVLKAREERGEA